ncbi:MAG: hypothetical protein ACYTEL_09485 [Planctomycetota bacterium]
MNVIKKPNVTGEDITVMHESMHWFQDVGTAYGIMWHTLYEAPIKLVNSYCRRHSELFPSRKIQVPLAKCCPDDDYLRGYWFTATNHSILIRLLEGTQEATEKHAVKVQALSAYNYIDPEYCTGYWRSIGKRAKNSKRPASPKALDSKPLGALALLEGQAHAVGEIALALSLVQSKASAEKLFDRKRHYGIYSRALDLMSRILGWADLAKGDPVEAAFNLLTFSAVCDLALSTPLSPVYRKFWQPSYSWTDFHPGWRFVRICALISKDPDRISLDGTDIDAFGRFADLICREFNWPTPVEIAENAPALGASLLAELAKRASNVRAMNPAIFVDPFLHRDGDDRWLLSVKKLYESVAPPSMKADRADRCYRGGVKPPIKWHGFEIEHLEEVAAWIEFNSKLSEVANHLLYGKGKVDHCCRVADTEYLMKWVTGLPLNAFEWE